MLKYSANNQTFYRSKTQSHKWLGRRDSNPRMPAPKAGALPLGDAPVSNENNRTILAQKGDIFNLAGEYWRNK